MDPLLFPLKLLYYHSIIFTGFLIARAILPVQFLDKWSYLISNDYLSNLKYPSSLLTTCTFTFFVIQIDFTTGKA